MKIENLSLKKIFALVLILFITQCGQKANEEQQKISIGKDFKGEEQVFFSAENPGKWADYKVDHAVDIKQVKDNQFIKITAEVPLKVTPDHFIETIVLVDSKGKEIESIPFTRGQKPTTSFWVLSKNKGMYYIVLKCNLHDMWKSPLQIK